MAKPGPFLIGIAGGSGAGKSWLTERIERALGRKAVRFSLDDFYRDRSHLSPVRRARLNFDHPRAIDWAAFINALTALKTGKTADIPCYNFSTHCREQRLRSLKPGPVVLVDGLWLFRTPKLRRSFDLRVFVDAPARVRLRRRLERDTQKRGRTAKSAREQFRKSVEPMHQRYVAPQARWADLKFMKGVTAEDLRRVMKVIRAWMNPPQPIWLPNPRLNEKN